jgi:hypothetical protein
MGRPERVIDRQAGPVQEFAYRLRELRETAGRPSYRELAQRAHYSASVLSQAGGGQAFPSLAVTLAFAEACGADRQLWAKQWREAAARVRRPDPEKVHTEPAIFQPANATPSPPRDCEAVTTSTIRAGALIPEPAIDGADQGLPHRIPRTVDGNAAFERPTAPFAARSTRLLRAAGPPRSSRALAGVLTVIALVGALAVVATARDHRSAVARPSPNVAMAAGAPAASASSVPSPSLPVWCGSWDPNPDNASDKRPITPQEDNGDGGYFQVWQGEFNGVTYDWAYEWSPHAGDLVALEWIFVNNGMHYQCSDNNPPYAWATVWRDNSGTWTAGVPDSQVDAMRAIGVNIHGPTRASGWHTKPSATARPPDDEVRNLNR